MLLRLFDIPDPIFHFLIGMWMGMVVQKIVLLHWVKVFAKSMALQLVFVGSLWANQETEEPECIRCLIYLSQKSPCSDSPFAVARFDPPETEFDRFRFLQRRGNRDISIQGITGSDYTAFVSYFKGDNGILSGQAVLQYHENPSVISEAFFQVNGTPVKISLSVESDESFLNEIDKLRDAIVEAEDWKFSIWTKQIFDPNKRMRIDSPDRIGLVHSRLVTKDEFALASDFLQNEGRHKALKEFENAVRNDNIQMIRYWLGEATSKRPAFIEGSKVYVIELQTKTNHSFFLFYWRSER